MLGHVPDVYLLIYSKYHALRIFYSGAENRKQWDLTDRLSCLALLSSHVCPLRDIDTFETEPSRLHARLDSVPKYYTYGPYKASGE